MRIAIKRLDIRITDAAMRPFAQKTAQSLRRELERGAANGAATRTQEQSDD